MAFDTIVFDIGRVLVNFSLDGVTAFLKSRGAKLDNNADLIATTLLLPYERGLASTDEFIESLQGLVDRPIKRGELIRCWQQIFDPDLQMLALLRQVRGSCRTLLLSNTNELHWKYLNEKFGLLGCVDGALTSFEAGVMKPDARIYAAIEEKYQLVPETTVLIDDILTHIEAAAARGWTGVQHLGYRETCDALAALGLVFEN